MPDIELTLQEAEESSSILLSLGFMDNIRAGVSPYGEGLTFSVPVEAGVKYSAGVRIDAGVLAATIQPPTDAYAVHVGQGIVLLAWQHPAPERVEYYELLASTAENGVYEKYQRGEFRARRGIIHNVPLGTTIYLRLQAIGLNGAISSTVQVKLGKLERPLVVMNVRGIRGSVIPAGAIFTAQNPETGLLWAIQNQTEVTLN